ncbi:universal stress protein [Sinimarinibacterium flocculans]|uniref:universal stress protein n=1 Tax=Sinimarinibacterium flocculans TaxID=985250 RepID=UPI00351661D0
MTSTRKILLATDLSDGSASARDHAIGLATRWNAELHVCFVELLHAGDGAYRTPPLLAAPPGPATATDARLREYLGPVSCPVVTHIESDISAAPAVLRCARKQNADLLVIGTHARRGLERVLLGSEAAAIVRDAACPVLVVGIDHAYPAGGYTSILAAVDFSDVSAAALRTAAGLARTHGAALQVMHVLEPLPPLMHPAPPPLSMNEYFEQRLAAARQETGNLSAAAGVPEGTEPIVREGVAHECIVSQARTTGVDLIALGTHGRHGVSRLLLGSVAERVLRTAPCAVLVQPAAADAPASAA